MDKRTAQLERRVAELESNVAELQHHLHLTTRLGRARYNWETGTVVAEERLPHVAAETTRQVAVTLYSPQALWTLEPQARVHILTTVALRYSQAGECWRAKLLCIARVDVEGDPELFLARSRAGLRHVFLAALRQQLPGGVYLADWSISAALLLDCITRAVEEQAPGTKMLA